MYPAMHWLELRYHRITAMTIPSIDPTRQSRMGHTSFPRGTLACTSFTMTGGARWERAGRLHSGNRIYARIATVVTIPALSDGAPLFPSVDHAEIRFVRVPPAVPVNNAQKTLCKTSFSSGLVLHRNGFVYSTSSEGNRHLHPSAKSILFMFGDSWRQNSKRSK